MNTLITEAIGHCRWEASKFFIFSGNVFEPFIYYSHLGVLAVILFFGFFIYKNNTKERLNKLFFYLSLAISVWLFSDLVLWASDKMHEVMFFWTLEIILEPIIYIIALLFYYTFVDRVVPNRVKGLFYTLALPTLTLAFTNLGLLGFDLTNCDRVAIEGVLPKYGYFLEIMIVVWISLLGIKRYRETLDKNKREQILYTTIGICLFLFSFSLGNIAEVITENWYIGQIGYIGIPIFIAFLSYQIVKFETFNIKILGTQALVSAIWFLILASFFVRTLENTRVVIAITLAMFTGLAIMLIRSVKREVEQREKIEKLATELQNANEKLKELDQMKSEFLGLATHQIRAPLTAIKGYSSMLIEGDFGQLPRRAAESVLVIMKSCQDLINIVNDFLNVSRIEQGRMVYEKTYFELGDLVKEVVNEQKPNIQKAGLSISLEIPTGLSSKINADRDKIKQSISNIIDNAVKYTLEGGITVSVGADRNKSVVKIKDTGIGIDPSEISKLFSKFSRTKDANKTNVRGTGIGLYIARKMVVDHGGDIKVFSEGEGKGTTFTIELPKSG